MNRLVRYFLFTLLCLNSSLSYLSAQYKVSSNNRSIGPELAENSVINPAEEIAHNFFEFAQNGDQKKWESLLSKSCFTDNSLSSKANGWYSQLQHNSINNYKLVEVKAPRINQKIYLLNYGESKSKDDLQKLILVKELGKWRVVYAKL